MRNVAAGGRARRGLCGADGLGIDYGWVRDKTEGEGSSNFEDRQIVSLGVQDRTGIGSRSKERPGINDSRGAMGLIRLPVGVTVAEIANAVAQGAFHGFVLVAVAVSELAVRQIQASGRMIHIHSELAGVAGEVVQIPVGIPKHQMSRDHFPIRPRTQQCVDHFDASDIAQMDQTLRVRRKKSLHRR